MNKEMWKKGFGGLVLVLFFLGCTAGPTVPPKNFTAKMVTMGMEMPMAKMGLKSRVENPMMQGVVTISEAGSPKVIMMSITNKTYVEQIQQDQPPVIDDPGVVMEKTKTGSETLDGHSCTKYDVVFYKKEKPEEKFKGRIWEATDLGGLVIRHEMEVPAGQHMGGGTMVVEMKDVKVGAATADMFTVPADYRKVGSTIELMGGGGTYPGAADMDKMKKMMEDMRKQQP
jgi:hypothetical protein